MILSNILLPFISLLASAAASNTSCCQTEAQVVNTEFHQRLLANYLSVWGGDLALAETVFHPDVVLHADRFPSSTGKSSDLIRVTNREEFVAFVQKARSGWKKYTFDPIKWTGNEYSLAIRWAMHGVLGSDFKQLPTSV